MSDGEAAAAATAVDAEALVSRARCSSVCLPKEAAVSAEAHVAGGRHTSGSVSVASTLLPPPSLPQPGLLTPHFGHTSAPQVVFGTVFLVAEAPESIDDDTRDDGEQNINENPVVQEIPEEQR